MFTIQIYEYKGISDILESNEIQDKLHNEYALKKVDTYKECTGNDLLYLFWIYQISFDDINSFDPLMKTNANPGSCYFKKYMAIVFDKDGLFFTPYNLNMKHTYYKLNKRNNRLGLHPDFWTSKNRTHKSYRHTKHWRSMVVLNKSDISQKEYEIQIEQTEDYSNLIIPRILHIDKNRNYDSYGNHENKHSEKGNCWKTKKVKRQYLKISD